VHAPVQRRHEQTSTVVVGVGELVDSRHKLLLLAFDAELLFEQVVIGERWVARIQRGSCWDRHVASAKETAAAWVASAPPECGGHVGLATWSE
jgi:hypothetical protein